MKIRMDQMLDSIGLALEKIEGDLLGVSKNHGRRICILCIKMAEFCGLDIDEIFAVAASALLHDNALTEYMLTIQSGPDRMENFIEHCACGQRNLDYLPFRASVDGFILYHHERADGKGLFGLTECEIPLGASLIAIADSLDYENDFRQFPENNLDDLRESIRHRAGKQFCNQAAEAMLAILNKNTLRALRDDRVHDTYSNLMPVWRAALQDKGLVNLAHLTAHIIDHKSVFTRKHSVGLAGRTWRMSQHYNFDETEIFQMFLAASIHDLGKLWIPSEILEKPDKLSNEEFEIIKTHVAITEETLMHVEGLDEILDIAVMHHEKLDGSGYHKGLDASELGFKARLLACLDIYQAIREERPYHPSREHEEALAIMDHMVEGGLIDPMIVNDMQTILAEELLPEQQPPCFQKSSIFDPDKSCYQSYIHKVANME